MFPNMSRVARVQVRTRFCLQCALPYLMYTKMQQYYFLFPFSLFLYSSTDSYILQCVSIRSSFLYTLLRFVIRQEVRSKEMHSLQIPPYMPNSILGKKKAQLDVNSGKAIDTVLKKEPIAIAKYTWDRPQLRYRHEGNNYNEFIGDGSTRRKKK